VTRRIRTPRVVPPGQALATPVPGTTVGPSGAGRQLDIDTPKSGWRPSLRIVTKGQFSVNRQLPPARHVTGRPTTNGSRRLVVAALACSALSLTSLSAAALVSARGPADPLPTARLAAALPAAPAVAQGSAAHAASAAAAPAPASPAPARKPVTKPADQPDKGLVYKGLVPATSGSCVGLYALSGTPGVCTHGPDTPPPGLDLTVPVSPVVVTPPATVTAGDQAPDEQTLAAEGATGVTSDVVAAAGTTVPCFGDGTTGNRVQVLYVHGGTDRFAQFLDSFRTWAVGIDDIYNASAAETGGQRHVRFVTEPVAGGCRPTITSVAISDTAIGDFGAGVQAVQAQGFNRADRKYVMFTDAQVYCGIGGFAGDDRKIAGNRSNFGPSYGRTDNGCWSPGTAAHELGHNLGAVNYTAPNTSNGGHCVDEYDVMCYSDSPNFPTMRITCTDRAHDQRLDCNHDDYYSTAPPAGSYLATHFNVADNVFLDAGSGGGGGTDTTAPSVPGGLTAGAVTPTSVTVSWTASTDNVGVTGYDVFRNGVAAGSTATTSITVSGLTPATAYTFTVKAKDAAGNLSTASAGLPVTTGSGSAPVAGKTYVLVNAGVGTVLDVSRSAATNGTQVVHAAGSGATSQTWTATRAAGGTLLWKNGSSGLCMTVQNGSTASGAAIVQRTCTGGVAQRWTAVDRGSGRYELVNTGSGMAIAFGADRIDGWRTAVQRPAGQPWKSRMWTFQLA
jgi:chitodextrinase